LVLANGTSETKSGQVEYEYITFVDGNGNPITINTNFGSSLPGFPASDDFSGNGYNSGVVGDKYYDTRWTQNLTDGTITVNAEKLRFTSDTYTTDKLLGVINSVVITGDFEATITMTQVSHEDNNSTAQSSNFRCHRIDDNSSLVQCGMNKQGAASSSQWQIFSENLQGGTTEINNYSSDTATFKISRTGSSITCEYNDIGMTRTATYSGDVGLRILTVSRWAGGNLTVDWDDFSVIDGNGNPITINKRFAPTTPQFPLSDNFNGIRFNSGAIGDTNWDVRYETNSSTPNLSINNSKLRITRLGAAVSGPYAELNSVNIDGDFSVTVDWERISAGGGGGQDERPGRIYVYFGADLFRVVKQESVPALTGVTPSGNTNVGGSGGWYDAQFRIRRTSGIVYCEYNRGSGWITIRSQSNANTCTRISFGISDNSNSGLVSEFSNLTIEDGNGNPITI
jgi:hypothetical protein